MEFSVVFCRASVCRSSNEFHSNQHMEFGRQLSQKKKGNHEHLFTAPKKALSASSESCDHQDQRKQHQKLFTTIQSIFSNHPPRDSHKNSIKIMLPCFIIVLWVPTVITMSKRESRVVEHKWTAKQIWRGSRDMARLNSKCLHNNIG